MFKSEMIRLKESETDSTWDVTDVMFAIYPLVGALVLFFFYGYKTNKLQFDCYFNTHYEFICNKY